MGKRLIWAVLALVLTCGAAARAASPGATALPPAQAPIFSPAPPTPSPTPTPTPLPVYEDTLTARAVVDAPDMVAPEEVQVRLVIENDGDDPIGDVRVCRDSGAVVSALGALAGGAAAQLTFTEAITPTDTQLDEGTINYLLRYTLGKGKPGQTEAETLVPALINKLPAKPGVEFTRSLPVTSAKQGEEAAIAYRVKNTGNVALTDIRVTDALCGLVGELEKLEPGMQHTFLYRFTVEKTATSRPTLSYSHRATREVYKKELTSASVYLANEQLDISLEADKSTVSPDGIVTLTYRVVNNGALTYDRLRLSDQGLGEIAAFSGELRPGKDYVFTKTVALKSTTTFLFVLQGRSAGGSEMEVASNPLTVAVTPMVEDVSLGLSAIADAARLSSPGEVTFQITVRNRGGLDIRQVRLSERERGAFRTLAAAAPGDTVVEQSYWVDRAETFVFTAEITDAKGGRLTVLSGPVEVAFGPDGVSGGAARTPEGIETMRGGPSYQLDEGQSIYLRMMVGVLAALAVLITCVSIVSVTHRRRKRRQRDKHIRRLRRDYRRELKEDEAQRTKSQPTVRQDTIRRARSAEVLKAQRRKPGSTPHKGGKGGK